MANLATINNNILADSGIDPITVIVGSGTINYIPKFTASGTIGNSAITDNGTTVTLVSRALSGTSATFSGAVSANSPSEGATGEGLITGLSFKIDATGAGQRARMYVVSNTLSDSYGSGLQIQGANFAGDKAFGFNLNTSGGFELVTKNASSSFIKALTAKATQQIQLNQYGAGTFTGTRAYDLSIDSSGNIIEVAVGAGTVTGSGTANEITYWTGSSSIGSLTTATYPSLTELSYVKGVTSAIQTQLNAKQATITLTTTGTSGAATLVGATLNIPQYVGFANPMTTLGDIIYGAASGTATRLAGNTTAVKQYLSQTGTGTASAAPSWATIAGSDITGAALTETDDTNVTLTLGGTPSTALLRAVSITAGWTGQLSVARGGTGAASFTANQILYGNGTSAITSSSTFIYNPTAQFSISNTATTGLIGVDILSTVNALANNDILYGVRINPTFSVGSFTGVTQRALGVFGNVYINGNITGAGWQGAVIGSSYGGAGAVNGIMKANGSGTVSAASAGTDYQAPITLTTTGTSGAATFSSNTLNIPQYQAALTNPVTGTGTSGYISKFTGTSSIGSSVLSESGGNIYINSGGDLIITPATSGVNATLYNDIGVLVSSASISVLGTGTFSSSVSATQYTATSTSGTVFTATSGTTGGIIQEMKNTSGYLIFGVNNSAGGNIIATSAYASYIFTHSSTDLVLGTNDTVRLTLASTGAATFSSSVTANGQLSAYRSSAGSLTAYIQNGVTSASGSTGYGLAIESEASAATSYALTVRNLAGTNTYFHVSTETGKVGYVGVGTSSPIQKFQVQVNTNRRFFASDTGSQVQIGGINDSGGAYVATAIDGSTLLLNNYSLGFVGIGTSSSLNSVNVQISNGSGASSTNSLGIFNTATSPTSSASNTLSIGFISGTTNYVATNTVLGNFTFLGQANDAGYGGANISAIVTSGGNVARASGHSVDMIFSTKPSNSTGVAERMRITSGGNLQLNFNPGSGNLLFQDVTNGATMFYIIPATYIGSAPYNANRFIAANSSHISFETGGSERMRITSGGIVGIGTNAPDSCELQVHSPSDTDSRIKITNSATGVSGNVGTALAQQSSNFYLYNYQNGPVIVGTNGTERFRVESTGKSNLSSTDSSFGQFQIGNTTSGGEAGIAFISGVTAFGGTPTSVNGDQYIWAIGANVYSIGGNQWGIANKSAANYVAKIAYNSTSWTFSSDSRLKDIIAPISGSLNKLLSLSPVSYKWKHDEEQQTKIGLIAQEVYKYFPEIVDKPMYDVDANGKPLYWGLNYGDLTPILINAIQELKAELDTLKNKL